MATIPTVNDGDLANDDWPDAVTARLNDGFAYRDDAASQSLTDTIGSLTDLTLAAANVTSDAGSWFSDANDYVTVPEAGTYLITAFIGFANSGTGQRRGVIRVNGSNLVWALMGGANQPWGIPLVWMGVLAAGDDVSLAAAQNSGGSLNVTSKHLAIKRMW